MKKWASNPSGHAVFVVDPVVTDREVFSEVSFFFLGGSWTAPTDADCGFWASEKEVA